MEALKRPDESNAGFIVTAMRSEIARRQLNESGEEKLLSSLDEALQALSKIGEIGARAGSDIRDIVEIANDKLERRQRKTKTKEV
ncbi:YlcI/YnfO family protein [Hafnia alvei]|uniref:YlcI/YnfO family protein n=1 Tax=Hafnia alvei TaxID=569 RepID=UPI002867CF37|nr:YlcI/YnfO family protein [Hafnia alvei]